MNRPQKIALLYIFGLCLFVYGIAVGRYHIFPAEYLDTIDEFVAFEADTGKLSIKDKLESEVGGRPLKLMFEYPQAAYEQTTDIEVDSLRDRRESPRVRVADGHNFGYRAVFGALDFEGSMWGGLLLDGDSNVVHSWKLSTSELVPGDRIDQAQNVYGLQLLPDGSVIYLIQAIEEFGALLRVDACGNLMWRVTDHGFHHTISMANDGKSFWTFLGAPDALHHTLARVDIETGEILQRIAMKDVFRKNPTINIFMMQKALFPKPEDLIEISHGNDIDELTPSQAEKFKRFDAGDLLLSYRNHNLLFVIDPDTLKIKWWRLGATDRQHDSDWENGGITVFSNNATGARQGASDIVRINPETMKHKIIVNGRKHNFFSLIMGRHQLTDVGTRIITSSTQGLVLEVDEQGNDVWSFLNVYSTDEKLALTLSESYRLQRSFFDEDFWTRDCSVPGN